MPRNATAPGGNRCHSETRAEKDSQHDSTEFTAGAYESLFDDVMSPTGYTTRQDHYALDDLADRAVKAAFTAGELAHDSEVPPLARQVARAIADACAQRLIERCRTIEQAWSNGELVIRPYDRVSHRRVIDMRQVSSNAP